MEVVDILQRSGGSASFADLSGRVSARSIRAALAAGRILRVARGVYALPIEAADLTVARVNGGVLSRESAALHHGFAVVTRPLIPHVTVNRTQRRRKTELDCIMHRTEQWPATIADDETAGEEMPQPAERVTSPRRTVLDCARYLPFGEALAIGDSALRSGKVQADLLAKDAQGLRGPGRRQAMRVVAAMDDRAESALESMLRARVIQAGLTGFVPQYQIRDGRFFARVDLANPFLRIVLEADSFAFHGTRAALRRDCRRYVNLARLGWVLLRYSWEDVILDDAWVGESLTAVVAGRSLAVRRRAA
jgi:very-short-patch-repair endonuclease